MTCVILLNGDYEDEAWHVRQIEAAQVVVAADGGHRYLRRLGRWPRVLIGDFDSLDAELVVEARDAGVEVVQHPVKKDETDAELAVAWAEANHQGEIVLLGAFGGAFDHEIGHVALLRGLASRGRDARLAAPGVAATVVWSPARLHLTSPPGTRVSLLALTPTAVVTLKGLEYPLTNAPLAAATCRGLSNRIARRGATIGVGGGLLLVVAADGDERFARSVAAGRAGASGAPAPPTETGRPTWT